MTAPAYKFLANGAKGPFSGFAWPVAGAWVEVHGALAPCVRGIHVCRPIDLAHWLHEELWELETEGDALPGIDCVVVRRARLLRRVKAWNEVGARRFVTACIERAAELTLVRTNETVRGLIDDAREASEAGYVAVGAFSTALAVARSGPAAEAERVYRVERAWQAAWIESELISVT